MCLSNLEHGSSLSVSTPMRYWQWNDGDQRPLLGIKLCVDAVIRRTPAIVEYVQDRIFKPEPCLLLLQDFKFRFVSVGFD